MQFRRLVVMLSLAGFLTLGGLSISPSEALAAPATKSAVHKKSGAKKAVGKKSTAKARKTARTAKNTRSARLSKIKAQKRSFARKPKHRAPSMAMRAGLRKTPDPLELSSSVAYMVDQDTGEVFFGKNSDVQLPIASVTKLMTALVIM